MEATEDTVIEFFRSKAEAAEESPPYLLSFAGPDLADAGIDYRAALNGEKLKAFVERTQGEGRYRVVKHHHQRAKVGIVAFGSTFEFAADGAYEAAERPARGPATAQGPALLDFLDALGRLPSQALDGFVIPARVLVELAKRR